MARAPAMRRRTFRDHLLSRKVWQRLTDGGKAFTPPREEILPERQTRVPAETPPRSAAFSGRHGNARIVSLLLWQISATSLGPLPTTGSGPRRTRRLRLRLSEEHDPVAFQHLAGFLVPAKILPSDASGGRRVKPSSDGQGGGGGQCLALTRSMRTLCAFQRTARRLTDVGRPAQKPFRRSDERVRKSFP